MFPAGLARSASIVLLLSSFPIGCGRKGPPLPPLVRVPAAPAEFRAERRGDTVEIGFAAPSTNTDKTRPANIERVDVYGYTGGPISDAELIRQGERVASVEVRRPRDPNRTIDPDDPASDLEPLEGEGVDQGAPTQVFEELTPEMFGAGGAAAAGLAADGQPLPGFPCAAPTRTYVSVGVSTGGRPGPLSGRATVQLVPAPPPPPRPAIAYDEAGVTLRWDAAPGSASANEPGQLLPARPLTCGSPSVGYHVYEVGAGPSERRLTESAVAQPEFVDRRVEWGVERCYTVRAVHTIEKLPVESEPATPACATLADTFPPAVPQGLVAVASAGAINLIWDANTEKDLAGYIVLRAPADARTFTPVVEQPIQDTTFTDKVEAGTPYVYAVQAVDAAGNRSAQSTESTPETAR